MSGANEPLGENWLEAELGNGSSSASVPPSSPRPPPPPPSTPRTPPPPSFPTTPVVTPRTPPPPPFTPIAIPPGSPTGSTPSTPAVVPPPPATSWRTSLKPLFAQAIEEFQTFRMDKEAEPFKRMLASIATLEKELDTIEGRVGKLTGEATALDSQLKTTGMLPKGVANFRGKAGPTVYVAKKNTSYEARGNFMIDAFNFRVTNNKSFDAVLAKMQTLQTRVGGLITQARAKRNELLGAQTELNNKAKQYVEAIKTLRKAVAEEAKKLSQLARKAASVKITARPNQAQNVLGAYAEKKPGFFNRLFKRSAKGGTRRRSLNRKTRKGRKNTRR